MAKGYAVEVQQQKAVAAATSKVCWSGRREGERRREERKGRETINNTSHTLHINAHTTPNGTHK